MKKVFFILIVATFVSVAITSCKKSCVCYNPEGARYEHGNTITTKAECNSWYDSYKDNPNVVRCEWEVF